MSIYPYAHFTCSNLRVVRPCELCWLISVFVIDLDRTPDVFFIYLYVPRFLEKERMFKYPQYFLPSFGKEKLIHCTWALSIVFYHLIVPVVRYYRLYGILQYKPKNNPCITLNSDSVNSNLNINQHSIILSLITYLTFILVYICYLNRRKDKIEYYNG